MYVIFSHVFTVNIGTFIFYKPTLSHWGASSVQNTPCKYNIIIYIIFDSLIFNIPQNIQLANPDFNIVEPIHLLIGSVLFLEVLSIGQISLGPSLPMLQKTDLDELFQEQLARF